MLVIRLGYETF